MVDAEGANKSFTIFRAKEAPGRWGSGVMKMAPMTDTQIEGFRRIGAAGVLQGEEVKILVNFAKGAALYEKGLETCAAHLDEWNVATPPSGTA